MTTLDELVVKITADVGEFDRRLKEMEGKTANSSKRVSSSLGSIAKAAAVAGAAMGGIIVANGIKDMMEAERIFLRLEGVLKATGGAAGLTAEEIRNLGDELEATTFFRSEEVQQAAGVLATFKSVTEDTFTTAIRLSGDMAEVFGTDLRSAATQLGKALENPVEGLSALRRVGISFTEDQKKLIESLVDTGKKADAQRVILKALQDQIGGAGEKANSGLSGSFNNLADSVGNFGERLVQGLDNPRVKGAIKDLTVLIDELSFRMELHSGKASEMVVLQEKIASAASRRDTARSLGHTDIEAKANAEMAALMAQRDALRSFEQSVARNRRTPTTTNTGANKPTEGIAKTTKDIKAAETATTELKEETEKLDVVMEEVGRTSEISARVIKDSFGDALESASFDFKNFGASATSILDGLARRIARKGFIDPLSGAVESLLFGTGASAPRPSGDFVGPMPQDGGFLGNLFGGFFADGGRPPMGKVSVVGERGPELFIPDTAGTIIPNGKGIGGGVTFTQVINVSPGVPELIRSEINRAAPGIANAAQNGVFMAMEKGGRASQIVGKRS